MQSKVFWKSLLATPALLGAAMIVSSSAVAAEAQPSTDVDALLNEIAAVPSLEATGSSALSATSLSTEIAPVQISVAPAQAVAPASEATIPVVEMAPQAVAPVAAPAQVAQAAPTQAAPSATSNVSSLDEISQYSNDTASMSQVTSISQLTDVQPTDWAFQALQSLVERYGCIVGYPDSTYRGNQALTRYEFAAGLNACLDRISELIASSTADLATKEDLATLQRLQEEFAAELATLRGRVDSLEARTAELEANQFSTTTKLRGETIFAVGIPIDGDEDAFGDEQVIAGYRVRLNFDTSFTGDDLLRARLQARDFNTLNSFGGGTSNLAWKFSSDAPDSGATNDVILQKLFYTFPVGDRIQITLGAQGMSDSDWVTSTVSPFDDDGGGSLTSFGAPPQYNYIPGDAGAGIIFQLTDNLSLDLGYGAAEPDNPNPGSGLFNGDYGLIAQLTYLSDFVDAALTYANAYSAGGFGNLSGAGDAEVANTYGGQVNFKFGAVEIGGGVAYVPIRRLGVGDYDIWSYQATLAFRDFGGEGNTLGILAGVLPYASAIPVELVGESNQDNSFLVEGFYKFQVNDNISVTPGLIYIANPGNSDTNDDTFVGAIRTTFSF
ncbi:iron uptake porin [Phormidium tenue FACHB-886]|nr:iron uptake porin [Phormidium tenue FACHB-886]